jgi:hypothetical protein
MSTEKQAMQGGYRQLDKDGNVVEEHQTKPRPPREKKEAAQPTAPEKKTRKPKDSPANAETTTTGEQQS